MPAEVIANNASVGSLSESFLDRALKIYVAGAADPVFDPEQARDALAYAQRTLEKGARVLLRLFATPASFNAGLRRVCEGAVSRAVGSALPSNACRWHRCGEVETCRSPNLTIQVCFIVPERRQREAGCRADVLFVRQLGDAVRLRGFMHPGTRVRVTGEAPKLEGSEAQLQVFTKAGEREYTPNFTSKIPSTPVAGSLVACGAGAVKDVLVVGAGMAGAFAAHSLKLRGFRLSVVDAGAVPASGASALYAALAHPHWEAVDTSGFRLTAAGTMRLAELLEAHPECVHASGLLDLAIDEEEERHFRQAALSVAKVGAKGGHHPYVSEFLEADAASRTAGTRVRFGGWWYAEGRLVNAGALVRTLLKGIASPVLTNMPVRLRREEGVWLAFNRAGVVVAKAQAVVAAAGLASGALFGDEADDYGISPLYGRISILRSCDCRTLAAPVTGRGYAARTADGYVGVGATYERACEPVLSVKEAHAHNLAILPRLFEGADACVPCGFYEGVRAVAADRMPIAGPMVDMPALRALDANRTEAAQVPLLPQAWGLFALGSRGLSWGLMLAEVLAARMAGEPAPIVHSLEESLSPARHALRRRRAKTR